MTHHKTTASDVARKAHVSVSTVSRAFSRPDQVSEATRNKILAIADDLNFSISRAAGNLKSGKSHRIALLVGDEKIEWFTACVFEGLNHVLAPEGYDLISYPMNDSENRNLFFDNLPVRNNTDAVIVSSFAIRNNEIERLQTARVPLIGINVPTHQGFSATVGTNDDTGVKLVVHHLASLGHRKILYIYQTFQSDLKFSSQKRLKVFQRECGKLKTVTGVVEAFNPPTTSCDAILTGLLAQDDAPTAVFLHQDSQAIPFFFRARECGLEIPHDLSIIGYDDSTFAGEVGLTTIHQDPRIMAQEAARKTLDLINRQPLQKPYEEFPVELTVRSSTGAPRKKSLYARYDG